MDIRNLEIIKGDITEEETDAIVNAANTSLLEGGGVCGAIFRKAGRYELQKECDKYSPIMIGEAVITKGYKLKAKYIIHTAGPIYNDDSDSIYLHNSYVNSLKIGEENNLKSISFPSISTGIYGYPLDKAADIAINAIIGFNNKNIEKVRIVCFDQYTYDVYYNAYQKLISKDDEPDPVLMLFEVVSYLHKLGYEKLRIMSYYSPSGCYFRCEISVKENFDKTGFVIKNYNNYPVYKYTTGMEFDLFEEKTSYENSSIEEIAKRLFELYPELEKQSKGRDPEYVKWFDKVLIQCRQGNFPYAFEDYGYDIYLAKAIRLTNGEYIEYAPMEENKKMTREEVQKIIDDELAQGTTDEELLKAFYGMYAENLIPLDELKELADMLGFELTESFLNMSEEDKKSLLQTAQEEGKLIEKIDVKHVKEISLVSKYNDIKNDKYSYTDLLRVSKNWISYKRTNSKTKKEHFWSYKTDTKDYDEKYKKLIHDVKEAFEKQNINDEMKDDTSSFNLRVTFDDDKYLDLSGYTNLVYSGFESLRFSFINIIPDKDFYSYAINPIFRRMNLTKDVFSQMNKDNIVVVSIDYGMGGSSTDIDIVGENNIVYTTRYIDGDVISADELDSRFDIMHLFDELSCASKYSNEIINKVEANNTYWVFIRYGISGSLFLRNDFFDLYGNELIAVRYMYVYGNWMKMCGIYLNRQI